MDLEVLITSNSGVIAVETVEEERLQELLAQIAWRLNLPFFVWDCDRGLAKAGAAPIYQTIDPRAALESVAEIDAGIFFFKDLKHYLNEPLIKRKTREIAVAAGNRKTVVFSSNAPEYPAELREVLVDFPLPLPTKAELKQLVDGFFSGLPSVKNLLDPKDKEWLLEHLRGLTAFEARRALGRAVTADKALTADDLKELALAKKKFIEKDNLVEYLSPTENLAAIGGLSNLKQWIAARKVVFTRHDINLPAPKGMLLVGVPGCGKTLCARAVAYELGCGLIQLDPGKLYNKFIGETEANLRRVLKLAESLAPVVLLIDEIEKVLPTADSRAADGGLTQRVFGTFLTWLQDRAAPVFTVATSNNIDALPPEFTRKGRFDEIFFVDLPTLEERRVIFTIHLKRRRIDFQKIDIGKLAIEADGFSGAEIEQAVLSALYAVASGVGRISTELIAAELAKTIPLSKREADKIEALRNWAAVNTIKA